MIFIEFDTAWFINEFESKPTEYEYEDEPYSRFVDSLFYDLIKKEEKEPVQKIVLMQYPDGSRLMLPDEVTKYSDKDFVFFDFELNVWKHRYTLGFRHKTVEGLQILDEVLAIAKQHPAYIGKNAELLLVGEKSDEPMCYTCGGWKKVIE